jgi:hypothetical protein
MATGWEQLGSVLGGGIDRQGAFEQGRLRTAQTESALGLARERQLNNITLESQNRERERLRGDLARAGIKNHELVGTTMLAGLGDEFQDTTAGMLNNQELNLRDTAADPTQPNSIVQRALGAVDGKPYSPLKAVGTGGYTDITADDPTVMMSDLGESMIDENVAQTQLADARAADPDLRTTSSTTVDGAGKPPSGFVANPAFDPTKPVSEGNFAFVDARQPVMGARESVFFNRIVGGAKNAQQTIQNIVDMPVGTSAGVFGIGSKPGANIFTAGIDTLRNTVSSQDVQSYNTMIAGLDTNLAQIEGHGLAASDAFRGQYDRLALREGDTEFTRLRKLAEMAQTIQSGLDPYLSNPRVPAQQKQYMADLIAAVRKTIPFTHADVAALEVAPATVTLGDLIKARGLSNATPGAQPAAPGASAAPKAPLPPRNDKGWELLEDAQGNLAYVSPDGTQIEEVVQ